MQVADILYSNDGMSDKLSIFLNKTSIGVVITRPDSQHGFLWNQFLSTGPVGNSVETREGVYNLTVNATSADEYGVEIDSVSLLLMNCSNATEVKVHRNGNIYYEQQSCKCDKPYLTSFEISIIAINCVTCLATIIVQISVPFAVLFYKIRSKAKDKKAKDKKAKGRKSEEDLEESLLNKP